MRRATIVRLGLGTVTALAIATGVRAATLGVDAVNFRYEPASRTIGVGDTVRWTFTGEPHTVTSGSPGAADGGFDSGIIQPGGSYSVRFDTQGTFAYFCAIHPEDMIGTIVVRAAATPVPTSAPTPAPTPAPTRTARPSPSPKPTPTQPAAATPAPTRRPTPAATVAPTATATPDATPSRTADATATVTATATATTSATSTPRSAPSASASSAPSGSPPDIPPSPDATPASGAGLDVAPAILGLLVVVTGLGLGVRALRRRS